MPETYTGACPSVQSTFESCASRIDSLRTECTKSYGSLTKWPGPCECTYYAEDLMCFDEQELCASQVWSQVPDWFREGVTSCLEKDANYTVRAQLGTFSNPFTVSGLAGSQATATGGLNGTAASPGASISGPASATAVSESSDSTELSRGGVAGVVVGSVAGFALLAAGSYLLYRRRKARFKRLGDKVEEAHELHAQPALFESDTRAVHEKQGTDVSELPQQEPIELFAGHGVAEIGIAESSVKK